MKKAIMLVILTGALYFSIPPYQASYIAPVPVYADELPPLEFIKLYSAYYGANEQELLKVAKCESNLRPNAINYHDGGKGKHSVGIFQYQRPTWDRFSKLLGEDLDYYSYHDSIKLTAFIFAKYPQYKSHWSCSKITNII